MRHKRYIDLKSQHIHNRMVNDLRKKKDYNELLPERQDNK